MHDDFAAMLAPFDILGLTETWSDIKFHEYSLPEGYLAFHSHRRILNPRAKKADGGVAVLYKQSLKKGITLQRSSHDDLVWIKLAANFFGFDRDVYVCTAYIVGASSPVTARYGVETIDCLAIDCMNFAQKGDVLIMGDFNARCGELSDLPISDSNLQASQSRDYLGFDPGRQGIYANRISEDAVANAEGTSLVEFSSSQDLLILNGRVRNDPFGRITCYRPNGVSVVDYALIQTSLLCRLALFRVGEHSHLSDHCPLQVTLKLSRVLRSPPLQRTTQNRGRTPGFKWESDSAQRVKTELLAGTPQRNIQSALDDPSQDVEAMDQRVAGVLEGVATQTMRRTSGGRGKSRRKNKGIELSPDAVRARSCLQSLSKVLQECPHDQIARRLFYTTKGSYYRKVKSEKMRAREELVDKMFRSNDPNELWQGLKTLKTQSEPATTNVSAVITADQWTGHFTSVGMPPDLIDATFARYVDEFVQAALQGPSTDPAGLCSPTTATEVLRIIKLLKGTTSHSEDGICARLIKAIGPEIAPLLSKLFNRILATGEVPSGWKTGIVTPIYKKGDRDIPGNYRAITVSSPTSKIFMSILNSRLTAKLSDDKALTEAQSGFRKGRRTVDNLFTLCSTVRKYLSNARRVYACFVDFRAAYDSVWRFGLFYKLLTQFDTGTRFVMLLNELYRGGSAKVKMAGGELTSSFTVDIGLKQGCSLSPTLFLCYINDLAAALSDKDAVELGELHFNALMFADDIVLASESHAGLQELVDVLHWYTISWQLSVNTTKTQSMIFNRAGRCLQEPVNFGPDALPIASEYEYLGLILVPSGSMGRAVANLKTKATRALYGLRTLIGSADWFPAELMVKLVNALVMPVLLYGCEVWGIVKLDDSSVAEKFNLKACKMVCGVRKNSPNMPARGLTGWLPIKVTVYSRMLKFWLRSISSQLWVGLCMREEKNLPPARVNKYRSWSETLRQVLVDCDKAGWWDTPPTGHKRAGHELTQALAEKFIQEWQDSIAASPRLEFFASLGISFGWMAFMNRMNKRSERSVVSRFLTSTHRLSIERGRYTRPPTPRAERTCLRCNLGVIESEIHFLVDCSEQRVVTARQEVIRSVGANLRNAAPGGTPQWLTEVFLNGQQDSLKKLSSLLSLACDVIA